MTALILLILFSNITLTASGETENNTQKQLSSPNELTIMDHKITSQEISEIKNQMGSSNSHTCDTSKIDGHGTGFSTQTIEDIEETFQYAKVIDNISYTGTNASVDNSVTPWFPPIGDQDGEGSCVAWAIGYYTKTYQEAKEHGWDLSEASWKGGTYGSPTASYQDMIMSPDFIYSLVNKGTDQGANFEDAINLVSSIGVCSWLKMPYMCFRIKTWQLSKPML